MMVTREFEGHKSYLLFSKMNDDSKSSYQQEWESLFTSRFYLEQLRSAGIKGSLRNSHFRSVFWKIYLECLPEDRSLWIDTTKSQRRRYEEILDKFHTNPRSSIESMDINVNNPLSQSCQSPWNQYFQDSELKVTIQQDVVRTFPEIEFFHTHEVQQMMISILFSYAREYPHISYKQGMHELLAPIIFVLHYDQQAYLQASETDNLELDIRIMLNQNYIEHDAFFLFCQLMEAVEAWYTMSESPYSKNMPLVSAEPFSPNISSVPANSLAVKLKRIYEHLLKHNDVELFLYLEQMEIAPQIYGIRWLRLLFGREFPMHDLLVIWDAIFADSISFDLVDYIFVAMLISIRDLLLQSDYASCLSHLMHYPNVTDVHYIIDLALYLRDPGGNTRPDGCSVQILKQMNSKMVKDGKSVLTKNSFSKNKMLQNQSKPPSSGHRHSETRPKTLKISGINTSSREPCTIDSSPTSESGMQAKSALIERKSSVGSLDQNEFQSPHWKIPDKISIENKTFSNTLPRATIRNVMECRNQKFRPSELSQSFGQFDDKKNIPCGSLYREMVPLVPSSSTTLATVNHSCPEHVMKKGHKFALKDKAEEVKLLRSEISELRSMNEYCAQQITQHIEKLQESMIGQRLLYEDEMFIALAGLKRARDILKGTVAFTEEVINDDHICSYISYSRRENLGENSTCEEDNPEDLDFVLVSGEKCNKNGGSPNQLLEPIVNKNCEKRIWKRNGINSNSTFDSQAEMKCSIVTPEELNKFSSSFISNVNDINNQSKS